MNNSIAYSNSYQLNVLQPEAKGEKQMTCSLCGEFGPEISDTLSDNIPIQYFNFVDQELFQKAPYCLQCKKFFSRLKNLHEALTKGKDEIDGLNTTVKNIQKLKRTITRDGVPGRETPLVKEETQEEPGTMEPEPICVTGGVLFMNEYYQQDSKLHEQPHSALTSTASDTKKQRPKLNQEITRACKLGRQEKSIAGASYKCNKCKRCYATYSGITFHWPRCKVWTGKRTHHFFPSLNCYFCNKRVARASRMFEHIKQHTLEREVFYCSTEECKRQFSSKFQVKRHVILCHGTEEEREAQRRRDKELYLAQFHRVEKNIKCYFCGTNRTHGNLWTHIRVVHLKEKVLFKCDKCHTSFSSPYGLQKHQILFCNNDEEQRKALRKKLQQDRENYRNRIAKVIVCYFCKRSYTNNPDLEAHLRTHSGEVHYYHCLKCGAKFRSQLGLHNHEILSCGVDQNKKEALRNMHREQRRKRLASSSGPVVCNKCGKCCIHGVALKRHQETCGLDLKTRKCCNICRKSFAKIMDLVIHKKEDHDSVKTPICYFCRKKFPVATALERHLVVHTKERPYKHEACGQRFSHPRGRDMHARRKVPCTTVTSC